MASVLSMQGNQGYMKTFTEGENPLECKQYGNCFSQARNSMVHESVHTGEKLFECKQCGKCFSQAGNLRLRKRVGSGGKPYECKLSGKCFCVNSHSR